MFIKINDNIVNINHIVKIAKYIKEEDSISSEYIIEYLLDTKWWSREDLAVGSKILEYFSSESEWNKQFSNLQQLLLIQKEEY